MKDLSEVKIVVVTGVESSGKSSLVQELATYHKEPFVAETARDYLNRTDGAYGYNDLETIAKEHLERINQGIEEAQQFLFVDTAFVVLKIWSEEKFQQCAPWILNQLASFDPALYILCDMDIPYEKDALRENPNEEERKRLHQSYLAHMQEQRAPFIVVSGTKKERLEKVAQFIKNL